MTSRNKIILPLITLFVVFSGAIMACKNLLTKWRIDPDVLIIANVLFFLISLLVFFMQRKALSNSNPNVFVRSVMGGMLLKMSVCIVCVIVYRLVAGSNVSKISVFAAMFLYLLYLAVEVAVITKMVKHKNA
jgi:hypothetical protein